MNVATRRAMLAAGGVVAAGTVAAVALLRKPAPPIHTLVPTAAPGPPEVKIGTIADLIPAKPPAPPAPARFLTADGTARTLADHVGSGLIVNLWATWCVPCVVEMPELQSLARTLAAENILVLPLSSDRGGAEAVRRFYTQNNITSLPVLLDPRGEAARSWNSRGLPTTLIIDRTGREQGRIEGAIHWTAPETLAELRRLVG